MKSSKFVAAMCLALVTACSQAPSSPQITAPQGATALQALEGFTRVVGTAEFLATACGRQGIRKNFGSRNALIRTYTDNLIKQGYDAQELLQASRNLDQPKISRNAVRYLESKGARQGDLNSVCAVGRNEIAQGTAVGKLLRQG